MGRIARAKEVSHAFLSRRREPDPGRSRARGSDRRADRVGWPDPLPRCRAGDADPGRHDLEEGEAHAAAQERLDAILVRLRELGAEASGEVGHRDPIVATQDALRGRSVDEVILSTLPAGISRWLGQDVPSRLKGSVMVPVIVVTAARDTVKT